MRQKVFEEMSWKHGSSLIWVHIVSNTGYQNRTGDNQAEKNCHEWCKNKNKILTQNNQPIILQSDKDTSLLSYTLVVNPITVGNFAFLFNCTPVGL